MLYNFFCCREICQIIQLLIHVISMMYNPDIQLSTQKAFAESLVKLGARFKNIVVLNANSASAIGTQSFAKIYPERHFNFGNAFSSMIAAATGFTLRGKIPFVCSSSLAVSGKSWDQIRNYFCYANLNIKIIGTHAGLLNGSEGAMQQALEDIALFRSLQNMKIICPADAVETKKALEMMMLDYGSVYFRLFHLPLPDLYDEEYTFHFGKGHIYKYGEDICFFAVGTGVHMALEAAGILEREGFSVMVVNMASIKPIDQDLVVECAKQSKYLVTVEDHNIVGGLGSSVAEVLSTCYPAKLLRLGMSGFGESGNVDDLYHKYQLDGKGIVDQVQQWIEIQ